MILSISISDALTNEVSDYSVEISDSIPFEEVDTMHGVISAINPDCHVNFGWKPLGAENSSFICGMPVNMKNDSNSVEAGLISYDLYYSKWYN